MEREDKWSRSKEKKDNEQTSIRSRNWGIQNGF